MCRKWYCRLILVVVVCFSFIAEAQKVKYTQRYFHRQRKKNENMVNQNSYTFSVNIPGDFSTFDENTEIGLILGNFDVFHNFGDEDGKAGFSTIGEATDLVEEGFARTRVKTERGKGSIYAYAIKEITVGEKTKNTKPLSAKVRWDKRHLKMRVKFRESYNDDEDPLISTYPFDMNALDQWVGNPYSEDMKPISVIFGDQIYKAKDFQITGHVKFNKEGELSKAKGHLDNISVSAGNGAMMTMKISPDTDTAVGGSVTPEYSRTVVIGDPIDITATANATYSFTNWSSDGGAVFADDTAESTTVTLSAASTVTANFTESTLKLTVSPSKTGTTDPVADITKTVNTNEAQTITATATTGYHFSKWTLTGDGELAKEDESPTTVTVKSGAVIVTAVFEHDTSNLTMAVTPTGTGTTEPAVGIHEIETDAGQTIKATAETGYRFVKWTLNGNGTIADSNLAETSVTLTGSSTVTAEFEVDTGVVDMTMAVSPSTGGTTNPGVGEHSVVNGSAQTITATAATGYHFVNWTVAGNGTVAAEKGATTTVTLTGNATVTANFLGNTGTADMTLAVSPAAGGSTNPGAGTHTIQQGEPQTLEATAAAGYKFTQWTITGSGTIEDSTASTTYVTLDGDSTVTATFELE